jgi:CxxC motif-containing protein (DUF1111 family)
MMRKSWMILLGLGTATIAMAGERASLDAEIGSRLFKRAWVPGLSSTVSNDGLGPLFNARSCVACHKGLQRSAFPQSAGDLPTSAVLRVSARWGLGGAHPQLGQQIQTMAVPGVKPEAAPTITPIIENGLRRWVIHTGLHDERLSLSLRAAPDLSVAGLIESVDTKAIQANADPDDRNSDGISGRVHTLPDGGVGRFGWKAAHHDLAAQTRAAFATDLGLSSSARPNAAGDCTTLQHDCLSAPGALASEIEITEPIVAMITAHLSRQNGLARPLDGSGTDLFKATGCDACHTPSLPGSKGETVTLFSDLLLHDMGENLADGVAEGQAQSFEWRTPPLVRLSEGEKRGLLHDGRARSIEEAISWHGGEAEASLARFKALNAEDRRKLIAYLKTL